MSHGLMIGHPQQLMGNVQPNLSIPYLLLKLVDDLNTWFPFVCYLICYIVFMHGSIWLLFSKKMKGVELLTARLPTSLPLEIDVPSEASYFNTEPTAE
jgi:hypothetical protein